MLALILATVVSFTLPTRQANLQDCNPSFNSLTALDSVQVWYRPVGIADSILALSARVVGMMGDTLSVSISSPIQVDVWARTHNNIDWSCSSHLIINYGLSVPHLLRSNLRTGKIYTVTGSVGDTTKTGVYFIVQSNGLIKRVI